MEIYPMHFKPIYRRAIWGGSRIFDKYHRGEHLHKVAESWEIVDRKDQVSKVANGSYQNMSLHELIQKYEGKLLGKNIHFNRFPLLIKILDAHENLSVQVHPNEKTAIQLQAEAKHEAWYILEAKPESFFYVGLKPGVDRKIFKDALNGGYILDLLQQIDIQKDYVIDIPGGQIHAICAGSLLLEVQQNSDTTYRVYDWNRINKNKKPRELHIEKAMKVTNFDDKKRARVRPVLAYRQSFAEAWDLIKSPFFHMQRLHIEGRWDLPSTHHSFQIFFLLRGQASLFANDIEEKMILGRSYLVAAAADFVSIQANQLNCQIIKISLPLEVNH